MCIRDRDKYAQITALLDRYCPGINEEIRGFSDTVGVRGEQIIFYAMTYLERGCSLMAALPSKTENGHTMMARNYDFHDELDVYKRQQCRLFPWMPGYC